MTTKTLAFLALKAQAVPLDIMKIKLQNNQIIYGFLAVYWAFVSDVDINSETLRWLG